jgi:glycine cleavage system regulatory protein
MASMVLSVVGSDKPGLTRALAAAVLSAGGNWLESHLSRLGGLYVGSVLVELDAGAEGALRAAVAKVDAEGLEVRIAPALGHAAEGERGGEALDFSLVGQDRPGIVSQITALLSGLSANIETFKSWIAPEPQTGAPPLPHQRPPAPTGRSFGGRGSGGAGSDLRGDHGGCGGDGGGVALASGHGRNFRRHRRPNRSRAYS